MSVPELAEVVNTSRATAYARFNRLREIGTVTGFHAQVEPEHLGLTVAALLMVKTDQPSWRAIAEQLVQNPSVAWLGLSAGEADFVMLVRAENLSHLRDVVLDDVLGTPGVQSIVTNILLEEMRPDASLF